ncbi:MAG: MATE family efflux transporter [Candidatus Omnitrophica bacterium]|nr:MATE family efflux transporter [Candidatus Omnitrophota bacterium]
MAENRFRHASRLVSVKEAELGKTVLKLSLPLITANIFVSTLELVDAMFVGRLGSEMLAAVAMAGVIMFLLSTLGVGLSIGTVALVSRAFGEQNYEKADEVVIQSLLLAVIFASGIGILGWGISPFLLQALGARDNVLQAGIRYLRILFAGNFTMLFSFMGFSAFQGAGDTVTPMKIAVLSTGLNIILDPLMIFGLAGFPRLEVAGAAWATVISRAVGDLFIFYWLYRGRDAIQLRGKVVRIRLEMMTRIVTLGFPSSLQMLLRSFSAVVLVKIVSFFGPAVTAAYGVGGRIFGLFLLPGFGFGGAAATLVGQNLGAGQPETAEKSVRLAIRYYSYSLMVAGSIVVLFAPQIAALFNQEEKFVPVATNYLRYVALGAFFLPTGVVASRALQGAGEVVPPMVMTGLALYVVQIPAAWLLSRYPGLKETGIWLAGVIGNITHAGLMWLIFLRGNWKKKNL